MHEATRRAERQAEEEVAQSHERAAAAQAASSLRREQGATSDLPKARLAVILVSDAQVPDGLMRMRLC